MDGLLERLVNPVNHLTTLVGEGGAGKTRLALAVAQKLLGSFKHGVWFVPLADLAPASDARQTQSDMATYTALALGLALSENSDPTTQLLNYLRDKEMLLVLDNFEHLLASAGLVQDLLRVAPNLALLVTSRQSLNFRSETAQRLSGLPVPEQALDPQAYTNSAVQLFVERANRNPEGFTLTPDNLPAVLHICRLVQGLPLGIELAAAWIHRMTPGYIATTLQDNLRLLQTVQPDVPERHRSLWAVLEGSWALLTADEQRALATLAVFRGGCSAEAAQAIAGVELDTLANLIDKSLLRRVATSGRYDVHELLRQFAEEKLATLEASVLPARPNVAERHSAYYLNWVGQLGPALFGARPQAAIAQLRQDLRNLQQAWVMAVVHHQLGLMLTSLEALTHFSRLAGLNREAVAMLEAGIRPLQHRQAGDSPAQALALLGRLLAEQAPFLARQGSPDQAMILAHQALTLAETGQDVSLQVRALIALGDVLSANRDAHPVCFVMERALALARSISDRRLEAYCLARLPYQFTRTTTYQEQALELAHALDEYWLASYISVHLGGAAIYLGDYSRAARYWNEARRYATEIGNWPKVSAMENNLGDAYRHMGAYDRAQEFYTRALDRSRELGDHYMEAHVLEGMSRLYLHTRELDRAWEAVQTALQFTRTMAIANCQAYLLNTLGWLQALRRAWAEARSDYAEAIQLAESLDRRDLMTESYAGLAQACLEEGDLPGALGKVEQALALLATTEVEAYLDLMEIYLTCYRVLWAAHDPRARPQLDQAYQILEERARLIDDPALRQAFLEHVPVHRELVEALRSS